MTDLVKGVLGGAWSLAVGWILPTFLALQLGFAFVIPSWTRWDVVADFLSRGAVQRQALLLATAVVAGLVLSACQTPLYRVLEGYLLWPERLQRRGSAKQQSRRDRLSTKAERFRRNNSLLYALRYLDVARYPTENVQIAPTRLGNAIRRFEYYALDRYHMDSQLLWNHLVLAAPERASKVVEAARTNVDFFVALLYGLAVGGTLGFATMIAQTTMSIPLVAAAIIGAVGSMMCYRLALVATDEWDSATRALVDHGRRPLAQAMGLQIPKELQPERDLWRAVNTFLRRPYAYSLGKDVPAKLEVVRSPPSVVNGPPAGAGCSLRRPGLQLGVLAIAAFSFLGLRQLRNRDSKEV